MSQLKVNTIRHTGASSDAVTLATDGTCTAKITNRSNKNLIINGDMRIAQRGTSSTSSGYYTVDRFQVTYANTDEAPTQSQVDVASGTTPYTLGFRKAYRITNGNQTGGLSADDTIRADTKLEAQDIANSGWNYKSPSSYITLSYWVKSSVAQEFFGYFYTADSPNYTYRWSLGSLSADTWTKITKTIPGNSNLVFDNDAEVGCWINLLGIWGTDKTASDAAMNTWSAWDATKRSTDQATTWYTTNDATFEITGVQLTATDYCPDYPHISYGDELVRCQRYFRRDGGGQYSGYGIGVINSNAGGVFVFQLDPPMRAAPTVTNDGNVRIYDGSANANVTGWNTNRSSAKHFWIEPQTGSTSFTSGRAFLVGNNNDTSGYLNLSAEL